MSKDPFVIEFMTHVILNTSPHGASPLPMTGPAGEPCLGSVRRGQLLLLADLLLLGRCGFF